MDACATQRGEYLMYVISNFICDEKGKVVLLNIVFRLFGTKVGRFGDDRFGQERFGL